MFPLSNIMNVSDQNVPLSYLTQAVILGSFFEGENYTITSPKNYPVPTTALRARVPATPWYYSQALYDDFKSYTYTYIIAN